jgi:deoxyribonuclease-4
MINAKHFSVGIHISNINDIFTAPSNINSFQLFVSSTTNYNDDKYKKVLKHIQNNNINIVVHASYSINLSRTWDKNDWWIQQFINEIKNAHSIGSSMIVIHTGKKLSLHLSLALNNMYSSLLYIHKKTKKNYSHIKILIETPSGQGSETLTDIHDLCSFLNKFYTHPDETMHDRIGICIDTCHIFASGFDIRTANNIKKLFDIIDKSLGIDKVKLCHLNDSKSDINSKVDRHANIGYGMIGLEALTKIILHLHKLKVPLILETPQTHIYDDYLLISNITQKNV